MKYRIVECTDGTSQWYEIYYRFLFMWFPVTSTLFTAGELTTRQFATKAQAEYWVSIRMPLTRKSFEPAPVQRKVVSEYDH